jgi:hypothetical protein
MAMLAPCSQFCALSATSAVTATALITSRRRVIIGERIVQIATTGAGFRRGRFTGRPAVWFWGVGAGEILAAVQIGMIAGLPYTVCRRPPTIPCSRTPLSLHSGVACGSSLRARVDLFLTESTRARRPYRVRIESS